MPYVNVKAKEHHPQSDSSLSYSLSPQPSNCPCGLELQLTHDTKWCFGVIDCVWYKWRRDCGRVGGGGAPGVATKDDGIS